MAAVTMAAVLALASSSSCDEGGSGATVSAETLSSPATTSQECVVCLSELSAADGAGSSDAEPPAVRTLPGCGHGFHEECIGRWLPLRPECPLCRRPVLLEDDACIVWPVVSRAVASASATAAPAWARAARITCGFGYGRVVWTRSPTV